MNETTAPAARFEAANLAGHSWEERGRRASFNAARPGYGVRNVETGEFLSRDGVRPSAWRTKATAAYIAQHDMDWATVATSAR